MITNFGNSSASQSASTSSTGVINLSKGAKINLSKEAPGLKKIMMGLGWDVSKYSGGYDFDLDASAFLIEKNGKTRPENFVFYGTAHENKDGMKCDAAESVVHTGDNKTGEGEGDDEQILIDLDKVPEYIDKIAITVTIFQGNHGERGQNFGMVENAYCRIVNSETNAEVIHFDLGEDFSVETAIVVGEIYRYNNEWKFNAVGQGFSGGLESLCKNYGLEAEYR